MCGRQGNVQAAAIDLAGNIVAVLDHVPRAFDINLKMSTSYGEILVAPDFKIEIERDGPMIRYSDKVNGKINGGGINIDLNSNYGKIYLRKK